MEPGLGPEVGLRLSEAIDFLCLRDGEDGREIGRSGMVGDWAWEGWLLRRSGRVGIVGAVVVVLVGEVDVGVSFKTAGAWARGVSALVSSGFEIFSGTAAAGLGACAGIDLGEAVVAVDPWAISDAGFAAAGLPAAGAAFKGLFCCG